MLIGSLQLLAGCKVEGASKFEEARHKLDDDVRRKLTSYDKAVFERNLFVNWGDACLGTERVGSYVLVVEARNSHVVLSASQPQAKTAVGSISSNKLSINISE